MKTKLQITSGMWMGMISLTLLTSQLTDGAIDGYMVVGLCVDATNSDPKVILTYSSLCW